MIIFPAIDLRAGRVVRLRQGRTEDETVYGDDPTQVAARWQGEGAEWLHVVNLDGAFGASSSANLCELARIIAVAKIPMQFGGGLRDIASIKTAFALGVTRVIIGTAAIENPELVSNAVAEFGVERIVVGIDARDGMVATRGWVEKSQLSAIELAKQMRARGIVRVIYTDIARDGMLQGVNANATAELAREANIGVIASGGVASLRDVGALGSHPEIEGVIIGQALYTNAISLREAIDAGKTNHPLS
jgi:phosphoribosylformimino-5-aminoimidazole carboxamide ribotide isomerase